MFENALTDMGDGRWIVTENKVVVATILKLSDKSVKTHVRDVLTIEQAVLTATALLVAIGAIGAGDKE